MASTIKVSMADLKVAKAPDSLTTLGLGSCIGLTLYDPVSKIGGLVHYMLPDSTKLRNNTNIAKFGDTGIRELYNQMISNGANPRRMVAKIAGGAKMFEMSGNSTIGNVGVAIQIWQSMCFRSLKFLLRHRIPVSITEELLYLTVKPVTISSKQSEKSKR